MYLLLNTDEHMSVKSLSCPSIRRWLQGGGLGIQRRCRWCHLIWFSRPMREPHNRPQIRQGSPDVWGIPVVLWCSWVRFSDLLSWFELWNLIIALAQVACWVMSYDMTSVFWMLTWRPKDWYRVQVMFRECCINSELCAKIPQSSAYCSSQIWTVSIFVWARRCQMLKKTPIKTVFERNAITAS